MMQDQPRLRSEQVKCCAGGDSHQVVEMATLGTLMKMGELPRLLAEGAAMNLGGTVLVMGTAAVLGVRQCCGACCVLRACSR